MNTESPELTGSLPNSFAVLLEFVLVTFSAVF